MTNMATSGCNSQEEPTVPCDTCMGEPGKAVKSCLTCLVSFCEDHVRPHLENAKFRNHRLVEPLRHVDARRCDVHCLPLERFCLTDGCCLCSDCCGLGHQDHATMSLEEARAQITDELQKKHEDIKRSVVATEKAMEKLRSNNDNMKEYSQWKEGAADVCLPNVSVTRVDHVYSYVQVVACVTQELCDLILASYHERLSAISPGSQPQTPQVFLPDPKTSEDFLKYAKNLTFDPDTVHNFLRLTADNRKVTNTSPWQHSYVDHPDRFEHWRQAMTSQSIYEGRHYAEAELSGEGAHVGVTYKSIERKGQEIASCITTNDFSWCVGRNSRGVSAWHAGVETPLEAQDVTRIGVYVDFCAGHVSFYHVSGSMRLLHKYNAAFIEPLYLIAWLSKKENVVCLVNTK
ncbi:tripartite motif-containing protein 16-like isoform X2 [Vanacampus margaritifer]